MFKAVLFDWGNVLMDSDRLYSYCAQSLGIPKKDFKVIYDKHKDPFQRGLFNEEGLWQRINEDSGLQMPKQKSLWTEVFENAYVPYQEMISFALRLEGEGYKIGVVSNADFPSMEYFKKKHPEFKYTTFSCEDKVRIRKPEVGIYRIALERLGTRAHETIYTDDVPEYVKAYEAIGGKGVVCVNSKQAIKDIRNMLTN